MYNFSVHLSLVVSFLSVPSFPLVVVGEIFVAHSRVFLARILYIFKDQEP